MSRDGPGLLEVVRAAGGDAAVRRLLAERGGTRVYVPVERIAGSALAALVGQEAAEALAELRGGECVDVPTGRGHGHRTGGWRRRWHLATSVRRLVRAGKSAGEIARILGVSRTHVRVLRRRLLSIP